MCGWNRGRFPEQTGFSSSAELRKAVRDTERIRKNIPEEAGKERSGFRYKAEKEKQTNNLLPEI